MPGKGGGKGKAILTWIAFFVALAILLSLGTWQVERLAWKERLLADMADRFHLLKYGLAIVLVFIGGKMLALPWYHMPIQWSLSIVAVIIFISVVASLALSRRQAACLRSAA